MGTDGRGGSADIAGSAVESEVDRRVDRVRLEGC